MIDWTVNFGHLLTFAGFILGGLSFVYALRQDIRLLSARMAAVEKAIEKMESVLERLARQEERQNYFERRITAIEDNGCGRLRELQGVNVVPFKG